MKPRMKWYWRVLITWFCCVVSTVVVFFTYGQSAVDAVDARYLIESKLWQSAIIVGVHAPFPMLLSIWFYHLLTHSSREPGCTYCGCCGYILRGLVDPRCPECGTQL